MLKLRLELLKVSGETELVAALNAKLSEEYFTAPDSSSIMEIIRIVEGSAVVVWPNREFAKLPLLTISDMRQLLLDHRLVAKYQCLI